MSILDAYDEEFKTQCQKISNGISALKERSSSDADSSSLLIREIDGMLAEAARLIKQMELEVRGQDLSTRKVLTEKMTIFKSTLLSHKSDFERARERSQRSALIGEKSSEHRDKYMEVNDKLLRQNQVIADAQRCVAETEEVGLEITSELGRSKEKIEASQSKNREFGGIIDSGRKILISMNKRAWYQKMILFFVFVLVIIIIAVAVYFTTTGKNQVKSATSTSK